MPLEINKSDTETNGRLFIRAFICATTQEDENETHLDKPSQFPQVMQLLVWNQFNVHLLVRFACYYFLHATNLPQAFGLRGKKEEK